jgi:hypothetical protein
VISPWSASPCEGEVARYIGKYGSKGVSKAMIISGAPPYLLKTGDNLEGVDASVFASIEKSLAADRYAFFTDTRRRRQRRIAELPGQEGRQVADGGCLKLGPISKPW